MDEGDDKDENENDDNGNDLHTKIIFITRGRVVEMPKMTHLYFRVTLATFYKGM